MAGSSPVTRPYVCLSTKLSRHLRPSVGPALGCLLMLIALEEKEEGWGGGEEEGWWGEEEVGWGEEEEEGLFKATAVKGECRRTAIKFWEEAASTSLRVGATS